MKKSKLRSINDTLRIIKEEDPDRLWQGIWLIV